MAAGLDTGPYSILAQDHQWRRLPPEAVKLLLIVLLLVVLLLDHPVPLLQHLLEERDQLLITVQLVIFIPDVVVDWAVAEDVFLLLPLATPTEPVCPLKRLSSEKFPAMSSISVLMA